MRGPNGERLGDEVEGEDAQVRSMCPTLVVVDAEGVERPGYMLRAGDFITQTDYNHGRRVMTAHVGRIPKWTLRLRLRRWWEGRR